MKRRKQKRNLFENLDLDSLMDIMTCTVGLMLFIVIFAVLEAHGTRIKMYTPMVRDAPMDYERKLFLCQDGKIVLMDFLPAMEELFGNWNVTYENVPDIVREAKSKRVEDEFFTYSLDYKEWSEGDYWNGRQLYRSISLVVRKRNESVGETIEQLESSSSQIAEIIKVLSNKANWIGFSVDEQSLDVFRLAREICVEHGLTTGWDPGYIDFPLETVIIGGGNTSTGQYDPRPRYSKPQ